MNFFGNLASQLTGQRYVPAEFRTACKVLASGPEEFAYEYPSTMLVRAIVAKQEFNRTARMQRACVLCVMDAATRKVAVYQSIQDAQLKLGYTSASGFVKLVSYGYCSDKKLLFWMPTYEGQSPMFYTQEQIDRVKPGRRRTAHVFSTNLQTGQKLLHPCITVAAESMGVSGQTVVDILGGRCSQTLAGKFKVEVATLQEIHEFDKSYIPSHFKYHVAKTKDVAEFLLDSFESSWGIDNRRKNSNPYVSWRAVKAAAGLV